MWDDDAIDFSVETCSVVYWTIRQQLIQDGNPDHDLPLPLSNYPLPQSTEINPLIEYTSRCSLGGLGLCKLVLELFNQHPDMYRTYQGDALH